MFILIFVFNNKIEKIWILKLLCFIVYMLYKEGFIWFVFERIFNLEFMMFFFWNVKCVIIIYFWYIFLIYCLFLWIKYGVVIICKLLKKNRCN